LLRDAVPQGGNKKGADRGIDGIRRVGIGAREGDLDAARRACGGRAPGATGR